MHVDARLARARMSASSMRTCERSRSLGRRILCQPRTRSEFGRYRDWRRAAGASGKRHGNYRDNERESCSENQSAPQKKRTRGLLACCRCLSRYGGLRFRGACEAYVLGQRLIGVRRLELSASRAEDLPQPIRPRYAMQSVEARELAPTA